MGQSKSLFEAFERGGKLLLLPRRAFERRREDNFRGVKDFCQEHTARIWPRLSYVERIWHDCLICAILARQRQEKKYLFEAFEEGHQQRDVNYREIRRATVWTYKFHRRIDGREPPAEVARPYEKLPIPTDLAIVHITLLMCRGLGHCSLMHD